MGTFALISMTERRNYAILAALIVLLNLAVSLGSCIYFGPRNLAKVLHKSTGDVAIVWAFVFTVYMVSQVAMWSSITTRLWLMPSDGWKLIFHSVEQEL